MTTRSENGKLRNCKTNKAYHKKMLEGRARWVKRFNRNLVKQTGLPLDKAKKLRLAYGICKRNAEGKGRKFKLSWDEWLGIWKASGKLHLRGHKKECYVMARKGDEGDYEIGNVDIIRHEQNIRDAFANRRHLPRLLKSKQLGPKFT